MGLSWRQQRKRWQTHPWSSGAMQLLCRHLMQGTYCPALVPLAHQSLRDWSTACSHSGRLYVNIGTVHRMRYVHDWSTQFAETPGDLGKVQDHGHSAAAAADEEASRHRVAQQRRSLKPSEMLIPRDSMFYCSTFPARPGFPSSRKPLLLAVSRTFTTAISRD